MKERLPDFGGKVVSVVCTNEDTGQLIGNPRFERQGGRWFMVGTVPEGASEDDWMEGLPSAIAWDTVQDYVVFDSMADYLARLRLNRRRAKEMAKTVQPRPVSRFAKKRDGAASA